MHTTRRAFIQEDELYIFALDESDCFIYERLQWKPVSTDLIPYIKRGQELTVFDVYELIEKIFRKEVAI